MLIVCTVTAAYSIGVASVQITTRLAWDWLGGLGNSPGWHEPIELRSIWLVPSFWLSAPVVVASFVLVLDVIGLLIAANTQHQH